MTVIAAKEPFARADLAIARRFLTTRGFDAVYYPGIMPNEWNRFNVLPEAAYATLVQAILADSESVYQEYEFDIRPPTDDRPFFFHYFKWRQTPEILAGLGLVWQPFGGSGYFVLVALLILVAFAAAVLIIGPLLFRQPQAGWGGPEESALGKGRTFLYFAALGLGFLFVEVPLAQQFILVLREPVTALAVVLFAVLFFSGIGSLTAPHWPLPWALGILVLLITFYPILLPPITTLMLPLPLAARFLLVGIVMAPLGYFMGLPFALGLRVVQGQQPALLPWVWAINGAFSVISAVLAVMLALSWGFSVVLWLGAAAYSLAWISFRGTASGAILASKGDKADQA